MPSRFSRPIAALGRPNSLNWRTHLLFAIPALASALTFDYPRLGGSFAAWVVLTLFSILIPVATIEFLSQLLGKSSWTKSRPITVVAILVIAGLARGATFLVFGGVLGLVPETELSFRLVGAPIFVLAIYATFDTLVQAYLEHNRVAGALKDERNALKESQQGFAAELNRLQQEQITRVREAMAPAIWELKKLLNDASLSQDASSAITALRTINDDLVRPLSHSIAKLEPEPQTGYVSSRSRFGQFVLPARMRVGQAAQMGIFVPFTAVMSYSSLSALLSPGYSLLVALVATTLYSGQLAIWRKFLGHKYLSTQTVLGLTILIGLQIGLSTSLIVFFTPLGLPLTLIWQSMLFFLQSFIGLFLIGVVQAQRDLALEESRAINDELRLLNAQLRQQVWLDQQVLAKDLHGLVQGALTSSALRLSQTDKPTSQDLERVRQDVDKAMEKVGNSDYLEGQSFEDLMEQLCELWEGSCQVDYRVSSSASEEFEASSALAYCTLEVVREALNNAIKHGKAKSVFIEINRSDQAIALRVENDGLVPSESKAGFGSQIFEELTLSHKLITTDKTVFSALVPITQAEQATLRG